VTRARAARAPKAKSCAASCGVLCTPRPSRARPFLFFFVLHVSPKGSVGDGTRVLGVALYSCSGPGGSSTRHIGHTCGLPKDPSTHHAAWNLCVQGSMHRVAPKASGPRHTAHFTGRRSSSGGCMCVDDADAGCDTRSSGVALNCLCPARQCAVWQARPQ